MRISEGLYLFLKRQRASQSNAAGRNPTKQSLNFASQITLDVARGKWAEITLQGNITSFSFSNLRPNDSGVIFVKQGGAGSFTISWTNANLPVTGLSLSTAPGTVTTIGYMFDGVNLLLCKENYSVLSPIPTGPVRNYVNWTVLDSNYELYNSNRGIRKKEISTDGWTMFSRGEAVVTIGKRLIAVVDSLGIFNHFGLHYVDAVGSYSAVVGVRQADTNVAQFIDGGESGPTVPVTVGKYLCVFYESADILRFQSSPDGIVWTTHASKLDYGPAGNGNPLYPYYFGYYPNAAYSEMYIQ